MSKKPKYQEICEKHALWNIFTVNLKASHSPMKLSIIQYS